MIDVSESFPIAAPPQEVWQLVADPYAVVGCVPGAAIVGTGDDGSLDTRLTVKFGPVGVAFQALASVELEEAARTGRVSARGRDRQGGARFTASATFTVAAQDEGSTVSIRGEVDIKGPLASMIETGASVVVKRMAADFAACLQQRVVQANA